MGKAMRDRAFVALETERLVLRRFEAEDAPRFARYREDPQVARYQTWGDFSLADAERFIARLHGVDPGEPGTWFQFAITEGGALIGDIGLVLYETDPSTAMIGYTLSPAAQGKGFAVEAGGAVVRYAAARLGVRAVRAITDARNLASISVAERLGMRRIATEPATFKGEACLEHTYEIAL